jgi:nitrite reductase/ring-hydroxylating ferredoxin subunit/DMSO/TMAO reductase YedYZ heme-binding membrane subunit
MSHGYRAVLWNRQKLIYDGLLLSGVALFLAGYLFLTPRLDPHVEPNDLAIRAFGAAAFVLLHVILSIGPLCRLDPRFLPLLYNRRHMGVITCLLALQHARLVTTWYHDYGNLEPLTSLLVSNTRVDSFVHFPFEWLGLAGLVILLLMAATSHDFWLANLTAPVWKALHMGVYAAYALLVAHVTLGALQTHTGTGLALGVGAGASWVVGLHWLAAWRERTADLPAPQGQDGWVEVGPVEEIPESRARVVFAGGERIAVFRYGGKLSALSAVCQHQNGPLGEGRIIDGLVTCPWHGFQYDPASGASPPPFTERVPTFDVAVRGGRVFVDPNPHPPGTRVEPARIEAGGPA